MSSRSKKTFKDTFKGLFSAKTDIPVNVSSTPGHTVKRKNITVVTGRQSWKDRREEIRNQDTGANPPQEQVLEYFVKVPKGKKTHAPLTEIHEPLPDYGAPPQGYSGYQPPPRSQPPPNRLYQQSGVPNGRHVGPTPPPRQDKKNKKGKGNTIKNVVYINEYKKDRSVRNYQERERPPQPNRLQPTLVTSYPHPQGSTTTYIGSHQDPASAFETEKHQLTSGFSVQNLQHDSTMVTHSSHGPTEPPPQAFLGRSWGDMTTSSQSLLHPHASSSTLTSNTHLHGADSHFAPSLPHQEPPRETGVVIDQTTSHISQQGVVPPPPPPQPPVATGVNTPPAPPLPQPPGWFVIDSFKYSELSLFFMWCVNIVISVIIEILPLFMNFQMNY